MLLHLLIVSLVAWGFPKLVVSKWPTGWMVLFSILGGVALVFATTIVLFGIAIELEGPSSVEAASRRLGMSLLLGILVTLITAISTKRKTPNPPVSSEVVESDFSKANYDALKPGRRGK